MIESLILRQIDELDAQRKREDAWQIPRVEGEMLYHIALSCGAKTIVEIGTSYGFSGLFWAAALKRRGGQLHTIDKDPKKYNASRQTFAAAGLSNVVTNYLGDAHTIMLSMPEGIDIGFIDADKASTQAYFDLLWPKLRVGGSIFTDNAMTHREELADFVKHVRARPDASSVEVPIGNGVEWTIKLA